MSQAPATDQELSANGVDPQLYRELMRDGHWLQATIPDFISRNGRVKPDVPAFESLSQSTSLTWDQYQRRVLELAEELRRRLAIRSRDRVVLCLPDWLENHLFEDALSVLNCVTVRALLRSSTADLKHIAALVGAAAIVTPRQWRDIDFPELVHGWLADVPSLRCHIVVGEAGSEIVLGGSSSATEETAGETSTDPLRAHEIYLMTFTSGSTAEPKCVRHTSLRWIYISRCVIRALNIEDTDSSLCVAPHSSGLGIWAGHALPIVAGIRSLLMERFSVDDALSAIERALPTLLFCVPAQLIKLLDSPAFDRSRLSSLRAVMFAGAPLPYDRAREAEDRLQCPVLTIAGASDSAAFVIASLDDPPERRLGGWGKVADGTKALLVDMEGRSIETPYQEGMLAARGGFWSSGYSEDPEGSKSIACPSLPDWQVTGDLWIKDEDGYYRIVGRLKDIVIRGGQNISCTEVEEFVSKHPAVSQVAAVRMPDPVLGERLCAYVVPRAGQSLELQELATFLLDQGLARYKLPERLELVPEMPISDAGKVLKAALESDIRRKVGGQARV